MTEPFERSAGGAFLAQRHLYAQSLFAHVLRQIGLLPIFMDSGLGTPPQEVTDERGNRREPPAVWAAGCS